MDIDRRQAMDRTFEHRTRPYRACVLLLFVSTVLTLVGYCTSHWVDTGHDGHYGLWVGCVSGHGQEAVCNRHSGTTAVGKWSMFSGKVCV